MAKGNKLPPNLVADDMELAASWDPEKNKDLDFATITKGSNKNAWWRCPKGHSFSSAINNRARRPGSCPICSGRKLSDDNSLASAYPGIAAEWHPTKNENKTPSDFAKSSNKYAWWLCPEGHPYQTKINNRTNGGTNCPFCSGTKLVPEDSLGACFPHLAKEWHPTRNGELTADSVAKISNKSAWWKCSEGHDFEAVIAYRTRTNSPCPICTNQRLSDTYNLAFSYPQLLSEWDYDKNKHLNPEELFPGTPRKAWWRCPNGHSYEMPISKRTLRSYNCPSCSGQKLTPENSLDHLFPEIADEWHPVKNDELKPTDVHKSSNKKVWWLCPRGHSYQAMVNARTQKDGSACPKCTRHTSRSELRILAELEEMFPDIVSCDRSLGIEIDLFIPELSVGIEYDGSYYHAKKVKEDNKKNEELARHGITLLRIRQSPLEKLQPHDIVASSGLISKADIDQIADFLAKKSGSDDTKRRADLYRQQPDFRNNEQYRRYLKIFPGPIPNNSLPQMVPGIERFWDSEHNSPLTPADYTHGTDKEVHWVCERGHRFLLAINLAVRSFKAYGKFCPICSGARVTEENSLAALSPKIASEWHPSKNEGLKPDAVTCGSTRLVWWKCPKGHDFQQMIDKRVSRSQGCPFCSGRRVTEERSLLTKFPNVAREWHPSKNDDLTARDVTFGSGKKVWWRCSEGHDWETQVCNRTHKTRPSGCPVCFERRWRVNKTASDSC